MRIRKPSVAGLALTLFVAFGAQSCFGGDAAETETMTPLLLAVHDAPVPFGGSDGRVHLVYELWLTNFSSGDVAVEKTEVLGDGVVLQTLDAGAIASRRQRAGSRQPIGTMAKATQALLFLDVALEPGAAMPKQLSHRIS